MSSYDIILEALKELNEDIDSMRKYYPNIADKDFLSYVELDPTYEKGSNRAGKYTRWILKLANENKISDKEELKNILNIFDLQKKKLKSIDLMRYKTIEDLKRALSDNSLYKELTDRQKERENQRQRKLVDLNNEAKLVYEDEKWEIWIPLTYAASCKLGQGSKWCTATTTSDKSYNDYKDRFGGDYYIIIDKKDPKNTKYQFHFESEQFTDIDNIFIDMVDFLMENPKIYKYFDSIGYTGKIYYTGGRKKYLPTYREFQTSNY